MTTLLAKLPREVGGTEGPLVAQFEVIEASAHADGSRGWNLAFTASSAGLAAARLPDEGVAEILASSTDGTWPAFCGTFPLSGCAEPVAGGVRLTGRWGFGSGIRDAAWIACGAVGADATPVWCALPVHQATIHDTWDSPGLAGTQSCDFSVDGVVVPTHRTFTLTGAPRRGGPLFRLPTHAYLTPDHTGITLGCARRALDECIAQARGNQRLGSAHALDQRPAFVRDLGRHHTRLAAARGHVRDVLAGLDATTAGGEPGEITPAQLLDARTAATHAAEVAVDVATFAYRHGGARAVLASSALGRAYRDTMTSSQHVHVLDDVYEWRGAALLA